MSKLFKGCLVVLLAYLGVSLAEPPRWRSNSRFSRLQRLEAPPPAVSQWKPSAGPPQPIPQRVYGPPTPAPSYGPPPTPAASYGPPTPAASFGPPPASSYGPPSEEYPDLTTPEPEVTTTEVSITTEENSESTNEEQSQNGRIRQKPDTGVYYIFHPNGPLQKVIYSTNNDVAKMEFNARLQYQNVEPITNPIYTYDPQTYIFQRIYK